MRVLFLSPWMLAFCALAACSFSLRPATNEQDALSPDDDATIDTPAAMVPHYAKRISITVGSPSLLVDFPVSVVMATDADLAAHARDDGADLAMAALDGTPLGYEIVAFDGATGRLEAWVRIPAVTAMTEIELRYGSDPVVSNPASTWSPAMFAGVWHLAEPGAMWRDSATAHAVQPTSTTATAVPTAGIVGGARLFDGLDDTATAGDPIDGSLDFGTSSFSVGVWVYVTQSANPYDMVIDKGGDTNLPGYCLTLGTSNWLVELSDGPSVPTARFGGETALLNQWNHLVAVIDRTPGALRAFTNGVLANTTAIPTLGSLDAPNGFSVGSPTQAYAFRGTVDEVRVYKQPLSADWIAAEHRNLAMRSSFMTIGAEQVR